ncbi:MAG: hydrogenase maturation protease [Candidatus Sulfotelmatobacter sp.]
MPRVLIVAYGNPLRCDDGIAWRAADVLAQRLPESEVEIVRLHQLAPELADAAQHHELIFFVDAACVAAAHVDNVEKRNAGDICVREIRANNGAPRKEAGQFSHVYSPEKVLDLAKELYGAAPKAFVITVAGENFGHGDFLSAPVTAALPELVTVIVRLVDSNSHKS